MANTDIIFGAAVQITGILDMRGNRVTGLNSDVTVYPAQDSDGATKAYVDFTRAQIEANLPALADNGEY
jgi:hypothetical protein